MVQVDYAAENSKQQSFFKSRPLLTCLVKKTTVAD